MKKRILAWTLAAGMALLLTACSQQNESQTESQTAVSVTEETVMSETESAAESENTRQIADETAAADTE